jgi:hypothetical protein
MLLETGLNPITFRQVRDPDSRTLRAFLWGVIIAVSVLTPLACWLILATKPPTLKEEVMHEFPGRYVTGYREGFRTGSVYREMGLNPNADELPEIAKLAGAANLMGSETEQGHSIHQLRAYSVGYIVGFGEALEGLEANH